MIKNWELKIKENKSTLIINDWGVKSDDICLLYTSPSPRDTR